MIIIIILLSVLVLCVLFTILGFYEIEKEPIYDKKGKHIAEYREFSQAEQLKIKADTENGKVGYYDNIPCKFKHRLVPDKYADCEDIKICIPMIIGGFILLANIACGIACLVANSTNRKQQIYTDYQMQINNLKQEAVTIDNYLTGDLVMKIEASGSVYHVIVDHSFEIKDSIISYNKSVNALKADLYMRKVRCSNPWTSWFWCNGAELLEDYNADAKIYTDILPTLMTYEIKKV